MTVTRANPPNLPFLGLSNSHDFCIPSNAAHFYQSSVRRLAMDHADVWHLSIDISTLWSNLYDLSR